MTWPALMLDLAARGRLYGCLGGYERGSLRSVDLLLRSPPPILLGPTRTGPRGVTPSCLQCWQLQ